MMAKINTNLTLFCLIFAITWAAHTAEADAVVDELMDVQHLAPPPPPPEKFVKFRVYVQDKITGPNSTVWDVAQATITPNSSTNFALVRVFDNKMTNGTDPESKEVGRAQALLAFSDMKELAAVMNFNFFFTEGTFKNSTLTCVGRNPLSNYYGREMPIVGGTGIFRLARGYMISNTISFSWTDPVGGTIEKKYIYNNPTAADEA